MNAVDRSSTMARERVAGSRDTLSFVPRSQQRRRLLARVGRLSYDQQIGASHDDDAAELDRLLSELEEFDSNSDTESQEAIQDADDADQLTPATSGS